MKNSEIITAVVLAAGQSSRMGAAKQLLPWGDRSILAMTLQHVLASSVDGVLVVTGGYAERVAAVAEAAGVAHVHNADYAVGEMVSSLRVALTHLGENCGGIVVVLGDMPFVEPETIDAVVNAIREAPNKIVVPTFEGKRGHPVGFGRNYLTQLLALTNDQTPREVIQANLENVIFLPVETESVLIDIDDKASYERWKP